jgi:hypothetical protein
VRDERVVIAGDRGGTWAVSDIVIPEVACLGLFLGRDEARVLEYSERTAHYLLGLVRRRDPDCCVRGPLRVDVPDLRPLALPLPRQEGGLVMRLWHTYVGLVRHLLPGVRPWPYRDSRGRTAGLRYAGDVWYTEV